MATSLVFVLGLGMDLGVGPGFAWPCPRLWSRAQVWSARPPIPSPAQALIKQADEEIYERSWLDASQLSRANRSIHKAIRMERDGTEQAEARRNQPILSGLRSPSPKPDPDPEPGQAKPCQPG